MYDMDIDAGDAEHYDNIFGAYYGNSGEVTASESDPREVRVTNSVTGGEKGSKVERFDLIPAEALREVAKHYGVGAGKYAEWNWRRGYDWSLSLAALHRHLNAFQAGEDYDSETGSHHLAAVVFHCLTLITFEQEHPELDDRW